MNNLASASRILNPNFVKAIGEEAIAEVNNCTLQSALGELPEKVAIEIAKKTADVAKSFTGLAKDFNDSLKEILNSLDKSFSASEKLIASEHEANIEMLKKANSQEERNEFNDRLDKLREEQAKETDKKVNLLERICKMLSMFLGFLGLGSLVLGGIRISQKNR